MIKPGDVLLTNYKAENEPNFKYSILLFTWVDEKGAIAFIINKALNLKIQEFKPELKYPNKLYFGGPINNHEMHFVHRFPNVTNCEKIVEGLYWGGDFDEIKLLDKRGVLSDNNIRFFSGYSGWFRNQFSEFEDYYKKVDKINVDSFFTNNRYVSWEESFLNAIKEFKEEGKGKSLLGIEEIKNTTRKLLKEDKIDKALYFLMDNDQSFNSEYLNEFIVISGDLKGIENKSLLVTTSEDNVRTVRNEIRLSILKIIDNLS